MQRTPGLIPSVALSTPAGDPPASRVREPPSIVTDGLLLWDPSVQLLPFSPLRSLLAYLSIWREEGKERAQAVAWCGKEGTAGLQKTLWVSLTSQAALGSSLASAGPGIPAAK